MATGANLPVRRFQVGSLSDMLKDSVVQEKAKKKRGMNTSALNLEERRQKTARTTVLFDELLDEAMSADPTTEEGRKKYLQCMNMANCVAMRGMMEKMDLFIDAVTVREECDIIPEGISREEYKAMSPEERDKHKVPGHRRVSLAGMLLDAYDVLVDTCSFNYVTAKQANEQLVRIGFWKDENGLSYNPHFKELEGVDPADETKKNSREAVTSDEGAEGDVEERGVDLDRVRNFVKGNKQ